MIEIKQVKPVKQEYLETILGDDFKKEYFAYFVKYKISDDKELKYVIVLFKPREEKGDYIIEFEILYDRELYDYEKYKEYFSEILKIFEESLNNYIKKLEEEIRNE